MLVTFACFRNAMNQCALCASHSSPFCESLLSSYLDSDPLSYTEHVLSSGAHVSRSKGAHVEDQFVVRPVKPLPVMLAPGIQAPLEDAVALLLTQLPANHVPGKSAEDDTSIWVPTTHM